jgi:hypothetical protein
MTSSDLPSLYLPTERIIDYKYLIKVEQITSYDFLYNTPTQNIKTFFLIETLYLPCNESIKLYLKQQVFCSEDKIEDLRIKQKYFRTLLDYLNQIEYILSIPLKDLATLINEPNDLDKLVYWRYSAPEPTKETMDELINTPWFLNKIFYPIANSRIPTNNYPYYYPYPAST